MKTLIIDCDGVLYPEYQFPLSKEIKAIEEQAYANNISKENYQKISNETLKRGEQGLYNFILNLCNKNMNSYNIFCKKIVDSIECKIERNDELYNLLLKGSKKYVTKREFLVKWVGYRNMTWEPEENLKNCKETLDKYFKRKKIESNGDKEKNIIYNQLLKLSECQKNNHSYKNFGPSFKDVMKIKATVTELKRQNKILKIL